MSVDTDGSRSEDGVMALTQCLIFSSPPFTHCGLRFSGFYKNPSLNGNPNCALNISRRTCQVASGQNQINLHTLLIKLLKMILSKSSQIFAQSPFFLMGEEVTNMSHSPRGAVNALPRSDTLTLKLHNKPWQHHWPNGTWIGCLCLWETWGH